MERMRIIAITGASGSGKSHFGRMLAKHLGKSASLVEINEVVNRYHTYSKRDKFGTKIVNLARLNASLRKEIRGKGDKILIIVGHLAPELNLKYDIAVVTRSGLRKLSKRLEARGYPREKIRDNIVSEATDYCGARISARARETYEVETEREKRAVIDYIAGKRKGGPKKREINKINELLRFAGKRNRYGI